MKSPQKAGHHIVQSLTVTGGFLAGARIEFADGLNCLIGGRGTGKTTALEFLRFGLGLMPDQKSNPQRHRAIDGLVKANLGSGRLSVGLMTKNGLGYTAGRAVGESVQVLNEAGAAVPVQLDRDLVFSADVFSQNEIEEIASSPAAQLALLDRFVEEETSTIARDLSQLQRQLEQSTIDLRHLEDELDNLRATASEVPVIEERLRGASPAGGPDAQKLDSAHAAKTARTKEAVVPVQLAVVTEKATKDLSSTLSAFTASTETCLDDAVRNGVNRDVFVALEADVHAFATALATASAAVTAAGGVLSERLKLHTAALASKHATQEAEYRALVASSAEEGGRAAERATLQANLAAALAAFKEQQAKEKQREVALQQRRALLNRVSELRDERFAARRGVAQRLSSQFSTIRVTVSQSTEVESYQALLTDSLKGLGLKQAPTAERLAQVFLPTELAEVVATKDYRAVMDRTSYDEDKAKKVVDGLAASGSAYKIETVDLEDRPCIELLDGDKYKASPNLSTGQRCTTILPILLVQSERPLLIDQPEDNLDNAFVYETVVRALKAVKGTRQIIFVTHNPNIPVLGLAERVFVFDSDGHQATLKQVGTVDECKGQIETILEGGEEAFLERSVRYGH